eukprot:7808223-Pyramimonas_sp.AAC.1
MKSSTKLNLVKHTNTPNRSKELINKVRFTDKPMTEEKASQSPCTYKWKYTTPRFMVLPEASHG